MEGTNSFTFLTLMCFLILTGECIHGGNKCIHVFNVDEFFYSNVDDLFNILFIHNVFMEGTNVFTFSTLTNFFIHNGEYNHGEQIVSPF